MREMQFGYWQDRFYGNRLFAFPHTILSISSWLLFNLSLTFLATSFARANPVQAVDPCGCEDKPQLELLAIVNSRKFNKQDLGADTKSRVITIQNTVMEARRAQLDVQINNRLFEAEARKRGLSVAQLVQAEVTSKITEPTDAEAKAFYNQRKDRISGSYAEAKSGILTFLKNQRESELAIKLVARLRSAATIKIINADVTPPASEAEKARVFATVNGENITSRDIEESLRPLVYNVQQQVYNLRKQDLDVRINDMLLNEEAKRRGVTAASLLEDSVRAKLPIITDAQAQDFYNKNKKTITGDFETVKYQIIHYLMGEEERKLNLAFAEQLRRTASIQIFLTPPQAPKP